MFLLQVSETYFINSHPEDVLKRCFWIPFFLLSVFFFILLECILIKLCWEIKVMQGRYTFANLKMHLLYPYIWITVWLSIDFVVARHFFSNLWKPYQCYIPSTSENNSWHMLDTQEIFVECMDEWMQYFFQNSFEFSSVSFPICVLFSLSLLTIPHHHHHYPITTKYILILLCLLVFKKEGTLHKSSS